MRTLTDEQVREIAARHERARVEVRPIDQVTLEFPGMTIDDAYAAQQAWVDLQIANGARLVGRKIGLTSVAMQQQMKIGEPDFGALLDYMVLADGAAIDTNCHVDPGTGRARTVVDTIADNAADAGVILGGRRVAPGDIDLRWVGAIFSRNGVVEETGLAAGVLNHPALGIAWLAQRLAPYGLTLEPGQLVLSGSFTRAVVARCGDTFTADYGPLGTVSCHFV